MAGQCRAARRRVQPGRSQPQDHSCSAHCVPPLSALCSLCSDYPEYSLLAARIAVSNLHKQTKKSFVDVMTDLRNYINPKTQAKAPLISADGALLSHLSRSAPLLSVARALAALKKPVLASPHHNLDFQGYV